VKENSQRLEANGWKQSSIPECWKKMNSRRSLNLLIQKVELVQLEEGKEIDHKKLMKNW